MCGFFPNAAGYMYLVYSFFSLEMKYHCVFNEITVVSLGGRLKCKEKSEF